MLNGVDPIILFNFKQKPVVATTEVPKIPLAAQITNLIDLPVIPIYLSERLTGIYITAESKNIDIDTNIDALTSGATPETTQSPIGSTVKIEMVANRSSIGVALFSALADLVIPKTISKEYSITYLHGAVTVFAGLLHSFSIQQQENTDLYNITLELVKPAGKTVVGPPVVAKLTGAEVLGT